MYGAGRHNIGSLYRSPIIYQRGRGFGVGGLFNGLFNYLVPALKEVGRTLGKQSVKTGKEIIDDIASTALGRSNKNFQQILADRGGQAITDLSNTAINKLNRSLFSQSGMGIGDMLNTPAAIFPRNIRAARRYKKLTNKPSVRKRRTRNSSKRGTKRTTKTKRKSTRGRKRSIAKKTKRYLDIFE